MVRHAVSIISPSPLPFSPSLKHHQLPQQFHQLYQRQRMHEVVALHLLVSLYLPFLHLEAAVGRHNQLPLSLSSRQDFRLGENDVLSCPYSYLTCMTIALILPSPPASFASCTSVCASFWGSPPCVRMCSMRSLRSICQRPSVQRRILSSTSTAH